MPRSGSRATGLFPLLAEAGLVFDILPSVERGRFLPGIPRGFLALAQANALVVLGKPGGNVAGEPIIICHL